jgi:hypothetical protein
LPKTTENDKNIKRYGFWQKYFKVVTRSGLHEASSLAKRLSSERGEHTLGSTFSIHFCKTT